MSEHTKIKPAHLSRIAIVYVRQSSAAQVQHNRESTARQYALTQRAAALGWSADRVTVIDEDLGLSGATTHQRSGFARMTAQVALSHVGIILGLEVSRMARNNADWYRLLDLCSMTDTLIGDADGVYHPSLFNDRLLLGLKGTMSEAELHVLRARLDGGIRNKAARGELRRGLPVGFVWGEADGEVLMHPDAAVSGAVRAVFDRFAEFGSARRVWLWYRNEGLSFPLQTHARAPLRWVAPTYTAIHAVLSNPVYAGAYAYGKSRTEQFVDEQGIVRKRIRMLPRSQWAVLIHGHHDGYLDWPTFEANQQRLGTNTRPQPHKPGGALREGAALLQGLATCGHCGRKLRTHYRGQQQAPGYHCADKSVVDGRGVYCLAQHHDDATIAGILNKQERTTARGLRFTQNLVGNLRLHWNIPRYAPPAEPLAGELLSVRQAAREFGLAASTIHRWLNDGFIAGEQLTPGAPWGIRVNDTLKRRLVQDAPEGYVAMQEATKRLGVTRQTVLHRVQRGELDAVLVCRGRQKGLRIKVLDDQPTLFNEAS